MLLHCRLIILLDSAEGIQYFVSYNFPNHNENSCDDQGMKCFFFLFVVFAKNSLENWQLCRRNAVFFLIFWQITYHWCKPQCSNEIQVYAWIDLQSSCWNSAPRNGLCLFANIYFNWNPEDQWCRRNKIFFSLCLLKNHIKNDCDAKRDEICFC